METGAITSYIDVAQLTLYAFWIFFAGLVWYLRSEDKREGYPLESDRSSRITVQGLPPVPSPKTFLLRDGTKYVAPPGRVDTRPVQGVPMAPWPGAPLRPVGDPLLDAIGPASYANRHDIPDMTAEGEPLIVPLRVATDFFVEPRDPDPRGMTVIGADGKVAGTVRDLWIDRSEPQIRYLEVALADGARNVLLPINYARVKPARRQVKVVSINAAQFGRVPGTANPDQITFLEEDRVTAYYGGGHLYASPLRAEPVL